MGTATGGRARACADKGQESRLACVGVERHAGYDALAVGAVPRLAALGVALPNLSEQLSLLEP